MAYDPIKAIFDNLNNPVPGLDENGNVVGRIQAGPNTLTVPVQTPLPTPQIMSAAKPAKRLKLNPAGGLSLDDPMIAGSTGPQSSSVPNAVGLDDEAYFKEMTSQPEPEIAAAASQISTKPTEVDKISQLEKIYGVGSGVNWGAGLVGLGEAIAGRNPTQAVAGVINRSEASIQEPVDTKRKLTEEETRQRALDRAKRDDAELEAKRLRERDPDSDESKVAQEIAAEMGYNGDITKLTAERFSTFSPALRLKYEKAQRAAEKQAELAARAEAAEVQRAFQAEQRALDRDNQRFIAGQNAALARAARDEKRQDKEDQLSEELKTPVGMALTKQDAKDLKEGYITKEKFNSQLDELIDLRTQFGGEVANREAVERAKQLSNDLLLSYKNMAKLGVLSASDEAIINSIIPKDPLEFKPLSYLPGQVDPILSKLKKFRDDNTRDFNTTVATRTRGGNAASGPVAASAKPETKVINGKTYSRVNGGWVPTK